MDGDGDIDVVTMTPPGHMQVFRNDSKQGYALRVCLHPTLSPAFADGALVQAWAGGHVQEAYATRASGFGAHGDPLVRIGLGEAAQLDNVKVWWPSGRMSLVPAPALDRILDVWEKDADAPQRTDK